MAKRRHGQEAELPFVALMDTMTNVVGVLTIVLVMMGISIAHAVRKILSELPPATAAQVSQMQTAVDAIQAEKTAIQAKLAPLSQLPDKGNIEAELARLEAEMKDKDIKLFDLEALRKELASRTGELGNKQSDLSALISERDRLKALLSSTPVPSLPTAKYVRIPNNRDIPVNANLYYCYIRGDQAYFIDPFTAKKMVMEGIEGRMSDFIHHKYKVRHTQGRLFYDETRTAYDQAKLVNFFASKKIETRGQKITVPEDKYATNLSYWITIVPGKGDASLADMNVPNNRFQALMYKLSSYPGVALIFKVNPDGFETYLKAREIADAERIPCGWEIDGSTSLQFPLDFEVNRLANPPPSGPPPPPGGPPPPKRRLD